MQTALKGPIRIFANDMQVLEKIFEREGFSSTVFQIFKEGQVFGLIKQVNDELELHVRGFADFTLDSEIELSREYLEHPYDCKPCYGPILGILSKYGIRYGIIRPLPKDPDVIKVPQTKTPWVPLVALGLLFGIIAFVGIFTDRD
jgi:hypothetical protein